MKTACLIPVKELSTSMSRLGELLTQDEKIGLSLAMLEDVIEVVRGVGEIGLLVIVTRDSRVAEYCREVRDRGDPGAGRDKGGGAGGGLRGRGSWRGGESEQLLVIPSDMPQVSGEGPRGDTGRWMPGRRL